MSEEDYTDFNPKDYIREDAKVDIKRKAEDQIGAVQARMKKWADRIVVGGFNPKKEEVHAEGDVWEDSNGKQWTIKDGIKQTNRTTQNAVMPWWCPRCGQPLTHWLHEKFYRIRGACHNCVVSHEGKMRVDGVWEIYERRQLRRNEVAFLKDKIAHETDYIRTFRTPQVHFENGGWEELAPMSSFKGRLDELRSDIDFMKLRLTQIKKEEIADAKNYRKLKNWERKFPWDTWKAPERINRES